MLAGLPLAATVGCSVASLPTSTPGLESVASASSNSNSMVASPSLDFTPLPTVAVTALPAAQADPLIARAVGIAQTLQFPTGASSTARHADDPMMQDQYDEVDELDSAGNILWLAQFSSADLRSAMRLDMPPTVTTPIEMASAQTAAQRAATALEWIVPSPSRAYADVSTSGWVVQWDRIEAGAQVRGDGTQVRVWPNGHIAAVARTMHPLGPVPSSTISASEATQRALSLIGQKEGWSSAQVEMDPPVLSWIRPNGFFDLSILSDPVAQLAWVVNVRPQPGSDAGFTLLAIYVSAADGSILGGDLAA